MMRSYGLVVTFPLRLIFIKGVTKTEMLPVCQQPHLVVARSSLFDYERSASSDVWIKPSLRRLHLSDLNRVTSVRARSGASSVDLLAIGDSTA
jgi:hypothetical protein